ncbi:MAG: hypothetical protein R2854_17030 [Caldilineaceae bacterium]
MELYQQAERILIEDVGLVPIYHPILVAMVKPYIKGPMFTTGDSGIQTWERFRFSSREAMIYKAGIARVVRKNGADRPVRPIFRVVQQPRSRPCRLSTSPLT